MLILLPPSETKAVPESGARLELSSLAVPELTAPRRKVMAALANASKRRDAPEVLKVSPNLTAQIRANLDLATAATATSRDIYTGVLFDAARLPVVLPAGLDILVFSGLWGITRPGDRIPPYRLSGGVNLPGIGPLGRWWNGHLAALDSAVTDGEIVIDCRSHSYGAMWSPPAGALWVEIRVVRETPSGRSVVTHHAKYLRGVLTGALARSGGPLPGSVDELCDAAASAGIHVGRLPTGELVHNVEFEWTTESRGRLTYVLAK
ncbi:YaaA family protein [Rarobacter faecitabidus]|uniref:YaaA family protein n=1 Tax=Rarobacter faecitabidus TaxID=13243 RepID=UPI0014770C95|nr:peroxide stress protein YaaA [Rarobacter faecitabidus]